MPPALKRVVALGVWLGGVLVGSWVGIQAIIGLALGEAARTVEPQVLLAQSITTLVVSFVVVWSVISSVQGLLVCRTNPRPYRWLSRWICGSTFIWATVWTCCVQIAITTGSGGVVLLAIVVGLGLQWWLLRPIVL
jgi:hypothetical protein